MVPEVPRDVPTKIDMTSLLCSPHLRGRRRVVLVAAAVHIFQVLAFAYFLASDVSLAMGIDRTSIRSWSGRWRATGCRSSGAE